MRGRGRGDARGRHAVAGAFRCLAHGRGKRAFHLSPAHAPAWTCRARPSRGRLRVRVLRSHRARLQDFEPGGYLAVRLWVDAARRVYHPFARGAWLTFFPKRVYRMRSAAMRIVTLSSPLGADRSFRIALGAVALFAAAEFLAAGYHFIGRGRVAPAPAPTE